MDACAAKISCDSETLCLVRYIEERRKQSYYQDVHHIYYRKLLGVAKVNHI